VVLRHVKDAEVPASKLAGIGVHETIWGVDCEASLEKLVVELARDCVSCVSQTSMWCSRCRTRSWRGRFIAIG
jgi:hypothetical protein